MSNLISWIKAKVCTPAVKWENFEWMEVERQQMNELKKQCVGESMVYLDDEDSENHDHQLRTGIITGLRSKVGIIDINLTFNLCDAPCDVRVGDLVSYRASRNSTKDDWNISRVVTVLERQEAEEKPIFTGAEERGLEVPKGVENAYLVTERHGRTVVLDGGAISFDLDKVHAMFSPVVGDYLFLDMVNATKMADETGSKVVVGKIRWVGHGLVSGPVTDWDEIAGFGQVGTEVFFLKDACISGYIPRIDDEVNSEVIYSKQGRFQWRALEVTAVQAVRTSSKKNGYAPSPEVARLCRSKMGISVNFKELNFGPVVVGGEGVERVVKITNRFFRAHLLDSGCFYLASEQSQIVQVDPVVRKWVQPGETVEYRFRCEPKHIGYSKELYVMSFKLFQIGFNFELEVRQPDLEAMVSEHSRSDRKCVFYQGLRMTRTDAKDVIPGERPIQPPKFIAERLGMYNIVERFWDAVLDENNVLKPIPQVQAAIELISPSLSQDLNYQNYSDRFHSLLYLEEIDGNLKLGKCSMQNMRMTAVVESPTSKYLELEVPGLAEKRPSLLVGDKVLATYPWANSGDAIFEGFVHKTFTQKIWLKFSPSFHMQHEEQPLSEFNIRFEFGRTAIRRQHAGLDMAVLQLGEQILFPTRLTIQKPQVDIMMGDKDADPRKIPIRWVNPMLNENQKEVIRNVLRGEARPLPYLIFGPPGTGKTITLVELILQIRLLIPESKILVATPSNSSANLIAERLIDSHLLKPGDLVRLVGYHMFLDGSLSAKLLPYSTTGNIKMLTRGDEQWPLNDEIQQSSNRSMLGRHRITVGTCVALGQLVTMGFPQGHFTHLVVDEAGQATEPEILVPLSLMLISGQTILAGDPLQLGPVVGSNLASQYGLGESYLDRLIHRFPYQRDSFGFPETGGYDPRLVSRLVNNYRSLPEILDLANKLFYESHLQSQVNPRSSPEAKLLQQLASVLPRRDVRYGGPPAMVFHGVIGDNLQDQDSPSWFNVQEVGVVTQYVEAFYNSGIPEDDVGVITPYRMQIKKLRQHMQTNGLKLPKIGSVEEFQGQERKVIIMSAVRSRLSTNSTDVIHSLGFVASAKRLNVALTRAQCLLVIVGNPHVLMQDVYWRATVEYCLTRGSFTGCNPPLSCKPQLNPLAQDIATGGANAVVSRHSNGINESSPDKDSRLRRTANLLYSPPQPQMS